MGMTVNSNQYHKSTAIGSQKGEERGLKPLFSIIRKGKGGFIIFLANLEVLFYSLSDRKPITYIILFYVQD